MAAAIESDRARTPIPLDGADETILVEDVFDSTDDRLLLSAGFRTLDARQRRVLHLRFFAGLSQAEIARELDLSEMQVSRALRTSLERLRGVLGERPATLVRS